MTLKLFQLDDTKIILNYWDLPNVNNVKKMVPQYMVQTQEKDMLLKNMFSMLRF